MRDVLELKAGDEIITVPDKKRFTTRFCHIWTRVISHLVDKSLGLRSDQEILVASTRLKIRYPERLPKASLRDELQGRTLVFLTNNFTLPSETIAALYKARWEIELFGSIRISPSK